MPFVVLFPSLEPHHIAPQARFRLDASLLQNLQFSITLDWPLGFIGVLRSHSGKDGSLGLLLIAWGMPVDFCLPVRQSVRMIIRARATSLEN
jgi:hypothetical protein